MTYCPILVAGALASDQALLMAMSRCLGGGDEGCEWYERGCPAHPCRQVVAIEEELAALHKRETAI